VIYLSSSSLPAFSGLRAHFFQRRDVFSPYWGITQ